MTLRGGPVASCDCWIAVAGLGAEDEINAEGMIRRGRRAADGLAIVKRVRCGWRDSCCEQYIPRKANAAAGLMVDSITQTDQKM